MARMIDGDKLVDNLRLIATCWSISPFVSKEKHNGAVDMLREVEREVKEAPTLTSPNEPPRWTEQDKEDAKMIKRVFNGFQIGIVRDTLAQLRTIAKDGYPSEYINSDMFPSLKPGESATLDEIIGGKEND